MKYLLAVLIPLLVVGAAYVWRDALDHAFPWLKGWRTVIVNGVAAVVIIATDLTVYLAGFNWSALASAETAAMLTLSFNVANIALRAITTTPIGGGTA
jgi:hypothetical protein